MPDARAPGHEGEIMPFDPREAGRLLEKIVVATSLGAMRLGRSAREF